MWLGTTKFFFYILLIALVVFLTDFELRHPQSKVYPTISSSSDVLVDDRHAAEGFTVRLKNGYLAHFFRIEEGALASHVGQNGKIVKIISRDEGESWSEPSLVFDSPLDDRNVHGGITQEGRVIIFFRRFDVETFAGIDTNYIYSDDNGETWTEPLSISATRKGIGVYVGGTNEILFVPARGYMQSIQGTGYLELRFSSDGSDWSQVGKIWDYKDSKEFLMDEACFALIGQDTLIGIMRDEAGSNYYEVHSFDKGYTWSEPERTNIASDYFTVSPLIFTTAHDQIVIVATERANRKPGPKNEQSGFWFYVNDFDELSFPMDFSLLEKVERPIKSEHFFYGYPTMEKICDDEYIIVYTDAYIKENGKEDGNLYSLRLQYNQK